MSTEDNKTPNPLKTFTDDIQKARQEILAKAAAFMRTEMEQNFDTYYHAERFCRKHDISVLHIVWPKTLKQLPGAFEALVTAIEKSLPQEEERPEEPEWLEWVPEELTDKQILVLYALKAAILNNAQTCANISRVLTEQGEEMHKKSNHLAKLASIGGSVSEVYKGIPLFVNKNSVWGGSYIVSSYHREYSDWRTPHSNANQNGNTVKFELSSTKGFVVTKKFPNEESAAKAAREWVAFNHKCWEPEEEEPFSF